jgi:uncharacterized membrane protein YqjE
MNWKEMLMAAGSRSLSDVFRDILGNVQEIVRSEVRLVKTEAWEDVAKAKPPALLLATGGATAFFAILFLLLAIFYALGLFIPYWAAALIVGAVLAVVGTMILKAGVAGFKRIYPLDDTRESIKENVEWAKQHSK